MICTNIENVSESSKFEYIAIEEYYLLIREREGEEELYTSLTNVYNVYNFHLLFK